MEEGQLRAILEIDRDLTDERERETKALAASRLAAVGELAAGVAHEVNNPLLSISASAELLLQDNNSLPGAARDDLLGIVAEAQRAGEIIRNLLAFARPHTPERRPAHLQREIIAPVLALREHELTLLNIRIGVRLERGIPLILANPAQLQQVLHNLLSNARDAIREVFDAGTVEIRARSLDDMVELIVEDTGPGIPVAAQEKLFSPFFSTKGVGAGTGLGLAITYGIVRDHGGSIAAGNWGDPPSGVGERMSKGGARLRILLPAAQGIMSLDTGAAASVVDTSTKPGRIEVDTSKKPRLRVLVIEDEARISQMLARVIAALECDVVVVPRAEEGIELLGRGEYFDAILTDIRMPGIGGVGLYRWIVSHRPDLRSKLLFSSGDVVSPETQAFLSETSCPALAKPYELKELREKLAAILQGASDKAPANGSAA